MNKLLRWVPVYERVCVCIFYVYWISLVVKMPIHFRENNLHFLFSSFFFSFFFFASTDYASRIQSLSEKIVHKILMNFFLLPNLNHSFFSSSSFFAIFYTQFFRQNIFVKSIFFFKLIRWIFEMHLRGLVNNFRLQAKNKKELFENQ